VRTGDLVLLRRGVYARADSLASSADDLERDQMLREAGYKVVHFTWRQLFRETERLIARIRDAFARRGPL